MSPASFHAHEKRHYRELDLQGVKTLLSEVGVMNRDTFPEIGAALSRAERKVQETLTRRTLTPELREAWEGVGQALRTKLDELAGLQEKKAASKRVSQ